MLDLLQLYHTARHLRPGQVHAQVWHRLRKHLGHPWLLRDHASNFPDVAWHPLAAFLPPGAQQNSGPEIRDGSFVFLNIPLRIGWPPDWDPARASKLWQYNLHYFEWLWALDYQEGREAIMVWICRCSTRQQSVAWDPYPISLRLMNWCGFFAQKHQRQFEEDLVFRGKFWDSLYSQVEWLLRHLEFHLLGNHLLENAAALAFCGSSFEGLDAERWLHRGAALLRTQLQEQVLADGMHFERSPMYHSRCVYLLELLYATGNLRLQELVEPFLPRALRALKSLCHPDGQIALLNDSAFGITHEPSQLLDYAKRLGLAVDAPQSPGAWSLPQAGYYGWRDDNAYLVCDAGQIGPDFIPGHAHGDIFSFELSFHNQRIIVDSGVFDYVPSEMRRYCRSTAAHNTVAIDGQDQAEFWEAFRVARRGRPHDVEFSPGQSGFSLQGWHDGYQRLPGHPRHTRHFKFHADGVLVVDDKVVSGSPISAVSRLHLHPDCSATLAGKQEASITTPVGTFSVRFAGPGSLKIESSWFCPEFGRRIPNQVLAWRSEGANIEFGFCFAPAEKIEAVDLLSGAKVNGKAYASS